MSDDVPFFEATVVLAAGCIEVVVGVLPLHPLHPTPQNLPYRIPTESQLSIAHDRLHVSSGGLAAHAEPPASRRSTTNTETLARYN